METGWHVVFRRLALICLVILLCMIALSLGLMLGYGVIGDGKQTWAILSPDKWQELITKFTGK